MSGLPNMATAATAEIVQLGRLRAQRGGDALCMYQPARHDDTTFAQQANATPASRILLDADLRSVARQQLDAGLQKQTDRHFRFMVAASCILHAVAVLWVVWREPNSALGSGGQELESISIEIISASALESLAARPSQTSGGAAASTDQSQGPPLPVEEVETLALTKSAAEQTEQPPEAMLKPDPSAVSAEVTAAEIVKPEPKFNEAERQKELGDTNPNPGPDAAQTLTQPAIFAGGASSRAANEAIATDGSAGASSGQLSRYAIDVRLAIGRTKPPHHGGKGTVQIAFGLTETGAVRFAEVLRSSGSAKLDETAVRAIHHVNFPTPPSSMTNKERTYVVPFDFK